MWDSARGLSRKGTVVGVVRDFHYRSLHSEIEPAFFAMWQPKYGYLSMRIRSENVDETLAFIREKWTEFIPLIAPRVWFLDENIERMYQPETRFGNVTGAFSALAVFVACLGLIGLASFTADERRRSGFARSWGRWCPVLSPLCRADSSSLCLSRTSWRGRSPTS